MMALALYPTRPVSRRQVPSAQVVYNINGRTERALLEARVLSGLIQHPDIRTTVALTVGPEHFHTLPHAIVLDWMRAQFRDGFDLDALDVIEALDDDPCLDAMPAGGRLYFAGVFARTVSAAETLRAAEILGWAK